MGILSRNILISLILLSLLKQNHTNMKTEIALTFAIIFGALICNSNAKECQTEHPLRPDYCDGVCCPAVDGGGPGGCCPFFKDFLCCPDGAHCALTIDNCPTQSMKTLNRKTNRFVQLI